MSWRRSERVLEQGRFAIYGAGGCGRDLVLAARHMLADSGTAAFPREIVFVDGRPLGQVAGIPVLAPADLRPDDETIIAIADPAERRRIAERLNCRIGKLIAPTAIIGPDVSIGEGCAISDHVMITCSIAIGRHFQCNYYSYVAHDCVIGDFVTFAPRVSCNGNIHIGDGAFIGTGAVLRQGRPGEPLVIGRGAVVGMGAVVTRNVPEGTVVLGNPARPAEPRTD